MSISYPSILNAFFDGVLVMSVQGKIDFLNTRCVQIWKIPDEIMSSHSNDQILNFIASNFCDPKYFIKCFLQLQQHEENTDEVLLTDGRIFKSYSVPMTDDKGQFTGRVWFFSDITQQKEDQKTIHHQQNIITRSARMSALGAMAGGIAHEINNPLSIILAHAEMLADSDSEKVSLNLVQKTAEKIKDTTKRIAHIINGLRIFSRNSDKDPLVPVVLENIIEDTIAICIEKFKSNSIKVIFESAEKKLLVEGRASQLMQVFLNLLNNAADAVDSTEDKWITVTLKKNLGMVEVSMVDSGKGIDHLILEKIFQPFFTTKPLGKGTGLGLSISKGIIEEHGGFLNVDLKSIHTCFIIQLPLLQLQPDTPSRELSNGQQKV